MQIEDKHRSISFELCVFTVFNHIVMMRHHVLQQMYQREGHSDTCAVCETRWKKLVNRWFDHSGRSASQPAQNNKEAGELYINNGNKTLGVMDVESFSIHQGLVLSHLCKESSPNIP